MAPNCSKTSWNRYSYSKFTGYSTRAASTSAANRTNIPITKILESAGWSNATTFNKFYNKPVNDSNNFGQLLLSSITNSGDD